MARFSFGSSNPGGVHLEIFSQRLGLAEVRCDIVAALESFEVGSKILPLFPVERVKGA
jgi:hypothetical protein